MSTVEYSHDEKTIDHTLDEDELELLDAIANHAHKRDFQMLIIMLKKPGWNEKKFNKVLKGLLEKGYVSYRES